MGNKKNNLAVRISYRTLWVTGLMTRKVRDGLVFLAPSKKPGKAEMIENLNPIFEETIRCLIIEDSPIDAQLIEAMLTEQRLQKFDLKNARTLSGGLKVASEEAVDVILLDLNLPDSKGLETFQKVHFRMPSIPIIIMTGINDENMALTAVQQGAQDFISKGDLNGRLLQRSIYYAIERKKEGKIKEKLLYDIGKRYKELTGLYSILELSAEDIPLEDILQTACNLMPPSWQYPEITCARIVLEDMEFKTKNFKKTKWVQSSDIKERDKFLGTIETYYLEEMPQFDEGPFFKEERLLIDGIARKIGNIIKNKRIEENIHKLSMAVEQSPNAIIITDVNCAIEYVNQEFVDITGYSFDEVKGKNPSILKSGLTKPEKYKQLWETITSGRRWRGEFRNKKKNGELLWELAHISPIFDKSGVVAHYLAIKEDITELKKLEDQYFHAQKMEGIGRLAGGIAHDFNNYLSVISGYTEDLLEELGNDKEKKHTLERIQSNCEKSELLVRQLLTFSRCETIKSVTISLEKSVMDQQDMMKRLIPENINISINLVPSERGIKIDPRQLEQVVMNLIINACDSMPEGGTLTIETGHINFEKEHITSQIEIPAGRYAVLLIKDTGCGISSDHLSKVFEPFFTTKEQSKGTGLGLSICYGIVKRAGGFIEVSSEVGKGTIFYVYFPAIDRPEEEKNLSLESPKDLKGDEIILLVEDMADLREINAQVLRAQGYEVIKAENGEDAIDQVREGKIERVDLLLTDVVMPKMGGRDLAKKMETLNPDIKIIYTSGYVDNEAFFQNVQDDDAVFLKKPVARKMLLQTVREVLDRKRCQKII